METNGYANYESFKLQALASEPNVMKISLNEVQLVDKSTIKIAGKQIMIAPTFTDQLISHLGIPKKFIDSYSNIMSTDVEAFINFLKDVKGAKNSPEVYLLGKGNSVVGMQKKYMPREIFFKTFEDIMNQKNFEIKNMIQSSNSLHISATNKASEFNIGGIDHETFFPGFSFDNNNDGMALSSYIYRLVCANGMISQGDGEILKYEDPTKFYEGLHYYMKHDFVPKSFQANVGRAMELNASLAELEHIRHLIRNSSGTVDNLICERFVPTAEVNAKLQRNNIDPILLSNDKKKNIPTNVKIWDAINGLTDYASHNYSINVDNSVRLKLQMEAGNILNKKSFDTENIIILNR